jgi:hypothetical protein
MDEIERIETASSQIFNTLQRGLIDLHRVVKHRIAIPVNQVFVSFRDSLEWRVHSAVLVSAPLHEVVGHLVQPAGPDDPHGEDQPDHDQLAEVHKDLGVSGLAGRVDDPPRGSPHDGYRATAAHRRSKNIKRRQQRHDHRRHQLPGFQQAQDGVFGFLRVETVGHRRRTLTRESQFGNSTDHEHDFRVFVEGSGRGVRGNTGEVVGSGVLVGAKNLVAGASWRPSIWPGGNRNSSTCST